MPLYQFDHDRIELVAEGSLRIEKSNRKVGLFQQTIVIVGRSMRLFQIGKKLVQIGLLKQRCAPVYLNPLSSTPARLD